MMVIYLKSYRKKRGLILKSLAIVIFPSLLLSKTLVYWSLDERGAFNICGSFGETANDRARTVQVSLIMPGNKNETSRQDRA